MDISPGKNLIVSPVVMDTEPLYNEPENNRLPLSEAEHSPTWVITPQSPVAVVNLISSVFTPAPSLIAKAEPLEGGSFIYPLALTYPPPDTSVPVFAGV